MSKDVVVASERPLAVNKTRAARMMGVSLDFFEDHIAPEVKSVRRGGLRLYAVKDLDGWLERNAQPAGEQGSAERAVA